MEYILKLRSQHSRSAQGIRRIPIHDPYNTHPDYEVHPHQRIWFDVPLLRAPAWQSIQILGPEYERYVVEAIEFMRANTEHGDFVGFYDFEIDKMERNLKIMRENRYTGQQLQTNLQNFRKFFDQYDQRKGLNFGEIFPEFQNLV
jgi:hypothetical protein